MKTSHFYLGALVCSVIIVPITGCYTSVRQHPDFLERRGEINKVAIMPVESEIVLIKLDGQEPIEKEQERVCCVAPDCITEKLQKQGFDVINKCNMDEDNEMDTDLRFQVTQIRRNLKEKVNEMYKPLMMDKKKALAYECSLGSEINVLTDYTDADALLFTNISGFRKDGGEVAKDLAIAFVFGAMAPWSGAAYYAVLVDGTTGDILWANAGSSPYSGFEEKDIKQMVSDIFKEFPEIEESKSKTALSTGPPEVKDKSTYLMSSEGS